MRPRQNGRSASLMQIAAAIVGSVGAAQIIGPREETHPPHCPVVNGPCPGNDRGVICSAACRPADVRCHDPHCPGFGDGRDGSGGLCPPEHAEAWRFNFRPPGVG